MNNPPTPKIQPCPFCGCDWSMVTASENTKRLNGPIMEWFFVMCSRCEAKGPLELEYRVAIKAWNRRVLRKTMPKSRVKKVLPISSKK